MRGRWKGGGGVSTSRDSRSRWLQRMVRRCAMVVWAFIACEVLWVVLVTTLVWWILIHLEGVLK